MSTVRIGIDLMGNDNTPEEILKSVLEFKKNTKEKVDFFFFATKDLKSQFQAIEKSYATSINCNFTEHVILMDEDPLLAIRRKKNSSLLEGMHYLKDDKIDAFISFGNTGAMTAAATMIVGTFEKISRPCLLALIPTKTNLTAILDVGASITFTEENLVQFAVLGAAFQKSRNIINPKVGLLNIGTEQKKGTKLHQKAYLSLSKLQKNFNFVGNIEGKEVFDGIVDVLVTDGFTGNVFLKTSEGLASFVLDKINQNISSKVCLEILDVLKDLKKRLYYGEYPGAILLGIEKIIIKCHGYSSIQAILSAVDGAIDFAKNNIISTIKANL